MCRTGWADRLKPVFLPIQAPYLDFVNEFRDLCHGTLNWKDPLCRSLSFETQKQIVKELFTLTGKYVTEKCASVPQLASLLLQMQSWKEWFCSTRKESKFKKKKQDSEDLLQDPVDPVDPVDPDNDQNNSEIIFTSSHKRLHERKWNQLPETFRTSLIESQVFKENRMGGAQKSPVSVQFSGKKILSQKGRKRKVSIADMGVSPPTHFVPQDEKLYSKLVNKQMEWLKDRIRLEMNTKKYKLPYKQEMDGIALAVQKPRYVTCFSMFSWQKDAWLRLSPEQQKVIQERLDSSL